MNFDEFFRTATGRPDEPPSDYQCRLACGERGGRSDAEWLASDTACRSLLVNVPTGLGKTAAVILAWLWNRVVRQRADWPRRLVYCLPMRVLVEQTRDNAVLWLHNLEVLAGLAEFETQDGRKQLKSYVPDLTDSGTVAVHILMGGEDEDEWDLHPERDAIIIGTQDMLLSRALNRGYAASRARWPMHFGLLNNDSLWVFDEVQLMGPGLATTAQLEAFRHLFGSKDDHGCRTMWMSATLQRDWLKTVDLRDTVDGLPVLELREDDFRIDEVKKRWTAPKPLNKAKAVIGDAVSLASEIREAHRPGARTIVVVNTVRRACELFEALQNAADGRKAKARRKKGKETEPRELASRQNGGQLVLLHSRFRPDDRKKAVERALAEPPPEGTVVVSTQVIEAGVDVSATTLFTELAPWASVVQRFGRCNRRGEVKDRASVRWIHIPDKDTDAAEVAAPYELGHLKESAAQLRTLTDVGLASLPSVELPFEHTHVIRRKDLVDLFDTTPDLAGNDMDIDRFVRDVEETDVRVFWRAWLQPKGNEAPEDESAPRRQELCPTPVGEFRKFAREHRGKAWRWNFLDGAWEPVDSTKIAPGQVFLVHAEAGGYTATQGWNRTADQRVEPILADGAGAATNAADGTDADGPSQMGVWHTIAEHTDEVCGELDSILDRLRVADAQAWAVRLAARWHDRGKAHEVFQNAVDDGQEVRGTDPKLRRRERPDGWRGCRVVAKAPGKQKDRQGTVVDPGFWQRYERRRFRHELASALVVLDPSNTRIPDDVRNLIAYLVAAHHGKVRLSIRSLPKEIKPRDAEGVSQPRRRFARGVWDADQLPAIDLGGGVTAPAANLSLEPMELGLSEHPPFTGQPSWLERMIRVRESLGPFRLAYLEALLRAADIRASRAAEQRAAESAGRKEARHV